MRKLFICQNCDVFATARFEVLSAVGKDSSFVGCDTVSLSKQFLKI
jgi:hypothetical protein